MVAKKETAAAASQPASKTAAPKEAKTASAPTAAAPNDAPRPEFSDTASTRPVSEDKPQKAGERGPKSALEGGVGSREYADANKGKGQVYSVQCHTDERGVFVDYHSGESGDEAANKAQAAHGYKGLSIRGVDVASAPDANSMGGERDAAIMIEKAGNQGYLINSLGTDANAKMTEELAKADVKELGQ